MKSKRSKSIISDSQYCYLCQQIGFNNPGTEVHHCLHGTANRRLADEDGLTVRLCNVHHRFLHDRGDHDKELQQLAQSTWMKHYEKTADDFRERYGKNYL